MSRTKLKLHPILNSYCPRYLFLRCAVDNTLRIHPVRQNSQDNFLFIDDHPVSISTENFKLFNRITKPLFFVVVDGICSTIYKIDRITLKTQSDRHTDFFCSNNLPLPLYPFYSVILAPKLSISFVSVYIIVTTLMQRLYFCKKICTKFKMNILLPILLKLLNIYFIKNPTCLLLHTLKYSFYQNCNINLIYLYLTSEK